MKILFPVFLSLFSVLLPKTNSCGQSFDWQGHRGARGLMPENSLPAFRKALELGVTTLEMDVVITKDQQVVVSHEPWLSALICRDRDGKELEKNTEEKYNVYSMEYPQVREFDCGSCLHPSFPRQEKIPVNKPLLSDVFRMAEKYCKDKNRNEIYYNIEIKSRPEWEGQFHPPVEEFCDLVYFEINDFIPIKRTIIQSFDIRVLEYFHKKYPSVKLAYLVETAVDPGSNLNKLSFKPEIFSPYYAQLAEKDVKWLHKQGLRVIPWTVNDMEEMHRLKDMGVDGIITDYPDLIFQ